MKRSLFPGLVALFMATAGRGEVSLVERRLSADALLWVNCHWQQSERAGLTDSRFDFYRRAAFVGLTGHVSSVMSMRVYFEVGSVSPYDLYADFRWPNGIGLRVGQFIPPLGFEAWTPYQELKLIEFSIVERHWKPWGARDIGLMTSYDTDLFGIAGAVVNGNGRNTSGDDNAWKDVCGRVVLKPLAEYGLEFACRGYRGRYYEEGVHFWNLAGELLLDRQPFQILAEVQHTVWGPLSRNSIHAQAAYRLLGLLEPVGRFEMEFQSEDKYVMGVTGGVNFLALKGQLRVMLNYNYARRKSFVAENIFSQQTVSLQLQATI